MTNQLKPGFSDFRFFDFNKLKKTIKRSSVAAKVFYSAVAARNAFLNRKNTTQDPVIIDALENLCGMLYEDPVLRISDFKGIFAIDPRSHLFRTLIVKGSYESELLKSITPYIANERDAIDVGANIGFYAVMLAKMTKKRRVLSVEPASNALKRLRRNIEMNNVGDRVEVFSGVISNRTGSTNINLIPGKEEYSSMGEIKHPAVVSDGKAVGAVTEDVASITLDAVVEQKSLDPGFIKVDVEGFENMVFQGGRQVLDKYRPVILSELSDILLKENGSSAKEVIDLIKDHGYDVLDPISPSVHPGKKQYGDILCFPKEMSIAPKP